MLEEVKFMRCNHLRHLDHGLNAKYTSHRITGVSEGFGKSNRSSPAIEDMLKFPIMIDKSTDVRTYQ